MQPPPLKSAPKSAVNWNASFKHQDFRLRDLGAVRPRRGVRADPDRGQNLLRRDAADGIALQKARVFAPGSRGGRNGAGRVGFLLTTASSVDNEVRSYRTVKHRGCKGGNATLVAPWLLGPEKFE